MTPHSPTLFLASGEVLLALQKFLLRATTYPHVWSHLLKSGSRGGLITMDLHRRGFIASLRMGGRTAATQIGHFTLPGKKRNNGQSVGRSTALGQTRRRQPHDAASLHLPLSPSRSLWHQTQFNAPFSQSEPERRHLCFWMFPKGRNVASGVRVGKMVEG